ncbi:MAG: hypothetical protein HOV80_26065 [Polyangiaceae bacterium]|nr:hypothetical protein [Polyangiaceae bacterium]
MNFVLHAHLAHRDLGDPNVTLGAMLPDLWRMAARPARSRRAITAPADDEDLARVLKGVDHHLRADAWFHKTPFFTEGERATAEALAHVPPETSPRLRLFAHVTWEMCLDGALVRLAGEDAVRATLEAAVHGHEGVADRAAELHHGEARRAAGIDDDTFRARMKRAFEAVESFVLPAGYVTADGVALRLIGIRAGLGFPPPDGATRQSWIEALAPVEPVADRMVAELLDSTVSFLPLSLQGEGAGG